MTSIKRKFIAWRRRIAKERRDTWLLRYRAFVNRAYDDLSPVPTTAPEALAKVERFERHLRRLRAVKPPFAGRRLDLWIDGTVRHFSLWPSIY